MICVTSFPKSGATWFQFLMYACYLGEINRSIDVCHFYPALLDTVKVNRRLNQGGTLFVKSHHAFSKRIPFYPRIEKCIYLVRHPLDTIASRINHYQYEGNDGFALQKHRDNLTKALMKNETSQSSEECQIKGWGANLKSWLVDQNEISVHLIRYEDLIHDPMLILSDLNSALNLGLSSKAIKMGISYASFEKMKALEIFELENEIAGCFYSEIRKEAYLTSGVRFVNKGKTGNYREILNPQLIQEAIQVFSEGMKLVGYEVPSNKLTSE